MPRYRHMEQDLNSVPSFAFLLPPFSARLGFVCGECSDGDGGIALAVILASMVLEAIVLIAGHMIGGK